jgi:hypothetical protein
VSLGELRDRADLPDFAHWDQYEALHPRNAHRAYLRLEQAQFECPAAARHCATRPHPGDKVDKVE